MNKPIILVALIYIAATLCSAAQSSSQLINIGAPIHFVAPVFPIGITPSNEKVRLSFTVLESGAVELESIEVVDTTNVLYNQSAIDALSQFRYNPRLENGRPVATPNSRTLIEYKIVVR